MINLTSTEPPIVIYKLSHESILFQYFLLSLPLQINEALCLEINKLTSSQIKFFDLLKQIVFITQCQKN